MDRSFNFLDEVTKRRVKARVDSVMTNCMKLSSTDLEFGGNMFLSRAMACSLVPRAFVAQWPEMNVLPETQREFEIGDEIILDVIVERGEHIMFSPLEVSRFYFC